MSENYPKGERVANAMELQGKKRRQSQTDHHGEPVPCRFMPLPCCVHYMQTAALV